MAIYFGDQIQSPAYSLQGSGCNSLRAVRAVYNLTKGFHAYDYASRLDPVGISSCHSFLENVRIFVSHSWSKHVQDDSTMNTVS